MCFLLDIILCLLILKKINHKSQIFCLAPPLDSFYSWLQCDDSTCGTKTQQVSVLGSKCMSLGCSGKCKPLYSDHQLYTQLTYFEQLFNMEKYNLKMGIKETSGTNPLDEDKETQKEYGVKILKLLHFQMEEEMKVSSYNWVTPSFWEAAFS